MKKEFRKKVIADRKAKDKDFIEKNSDIITEIYRNGCICHKNINLLWLSWTQALTTAVIVFQNMLKCWNIGEFVNTLYAKGTSDNILHSKIYIDLKIWNKYDIIFVNSL